MPTSSAEARSDTSGSVPSARDLQCRRRARRTSLVGWIALPVIVIAIFWNMAACGYPDRRSAADAIADAIRSQPGVATVDTSYHTSFDGGANFSLAATMAPTVTDEQGAAIAHTFVDRMLEADFSAFDVSFELRYPRPYRAAAEGAALPANASVLSVRYPPRSVDPPADDVGDILRWWLDIARSPQVEAVHVKLPFDREYADVSPPVSVVLPIAADDTALQSLIQRHPPLQSPTTAWIVSVQPAQPNAHRDTYTSTGWLLDARSREAWKELVDLLRPAGQPYPLGTAEAWTQVPPRSDTQPPTRVRVALRLDWDTAGEFENVARRSSSLLSHMPVPALLELSATVIDSRVPTSSRELVDRQLAITVGGCTPRQPELTHPAEPLEVELRHQFEHC